MFCYQFDTNMVPIPWANNSTFQIHQSFSAQVIQWFFHHKFNAGICHFTLVLTTRFVNMIGNRKTVYQCSELWKIIVFSARFVMK